MPSIGYISPLSKTHIGAAIRVKVDIRTHKVLFLGQNGKNLGVVGSAEFGSQQRFLMLIKPAHVNLVSNR